MLYCVHLVQDTNLFKGFGTYAVQTLGPSLMEKIRLLCTSSKSTTHLALTFFESIGLIYACELKCGYTLDLVNSMHIILTLASLQECQVSCMIKVLGGGWFSPVNKLHHVGLT